jgi:hypothetical protein
VIIFGSTRIAGSLYSVPAAGGMPTPLIDGDKIGQERHGFPYFLPDGRRFLYL